MAAGRRTLACLSHQAAAPAVQCTASPSADPLQNRNTKNRSKGVFTSSRADLPHPDSAGRAGRIGQPPQRREILVDPHSTPIPAPAW